MKIRIITLCLIFIALSFSCKKEDLDGGTTANPFLPKLTKIMVDNESFKEYLYSDSGLIRQEQSKFDFTQHHYNAAGQLTSSEFFGNDDVLSSDLSVYETAMNQTTWVTPVNGKKGGVITYEYNANGQLIKTTTTRPSLSFAEYSEFEYNAENRINRQTMYWEDAATGYIDYAYDKKGNLRSESLFNLPATGPAELVTTTEYTFDSESNPFQSYSKLPIPGVNTNPNNILKETYTIHLSSENNVQVTENTYQYDALGYPISKNGNVTFIY